MSPGKPAGGGLSEPGRWLLAIDAPGVRATRCLRYVAKRHQPRRRACRHEVRPGRTEALGKRTSDVLYWSCPPGEMAEWFNAAVLKTAVGAEPTGGSNPSLSAPRLCCSPLTDQQGNGFPAKNMQSVMHCILSRILALCLFCTRQVENAGCLLRRPFARAGRCKRRDAR
jgi:hypothetical protein